MMVLSPVILAKRGAQVRLFTAPPLREALLDQWEEPLLQEGTVPLAPADLHPATVTALAELQSPERPVRIHIYVDGSGGRSGPGGRRG